MTYKEFTATINKCISNLKYRKQLELAITICKKLFFDYQKFSEIEQWGDSDLLLDAIKFCEHSFDNVNLSEVRILLPKIDLITPDTENFGDIMGSCALNACTSVYETLQFLIDRDQTHIFNIASYCIDTSYFKIQGNEELTETEINKHPLMIEARDFLLDKAK